MKWSHLQKEIRQKQKNLWALQKDLQITLNTGDSPNLFLYSRILKETACVQKRSSAIKTWIEEKMNFRPVPSNKNRGNSYDATRGEYVRICITVHEDDSRPVINLRQVRLWQDINRYLLIYIDTKNKNYCRVYSVPSCEISNMVAISGYPSHGTFEANLQNKRVEYSLTKSYNSPQLEPFRDKKAESEWFGW